MKKLLLVILLSTSFISYLEAAPHSHGGRAHNHALPTTGIQHRHGAGAVGQQSGSHLKRSTQQANIIGLPANSHKSRGNGWTCNKGFKQAGDRCLKIQIPRNAKLSYSGKRWACNKGFKKAGNGCLKIQIPPNAKLSYSGSRWMCNKGFKKIGNGCSKIHIPANAKLSYSGSRWVCNKSFKKTGNGCLKMSSAEIKRQQEIERTVRAKIQREKALQSDGTIAYQTKISSDSDEIIKLENGAIVKVSSYFGYLGYRKTAILYGSGHRCKIWIAGKKSYNCELLKQPNRKGQPAKKVHISQVKGNGTILMMLDGSIYEVDSIDTIYTSLWLGISDGLLINGMTLINFDSDEAINVSRIK